MKRKDTRHTQEALNTCSSIPFLRGRPDRLADISGDDITDLKIILNTTGTVREFLSQI
ncbi:hypothetical protein ACFL5V_06850 [Fibrobacterota bacterium]